MFHTFKAIKTTFTLLPGTEKLKKMKKILLLRVSREGYGGVIWFYQKVSLLSDELTDQFEPLYLVCSCYVCDYVFARGCFV